MNAPDQQILVTNYKAGLFNEPAQNVHKGAQLEYDPKLNELAINKALFVHVFNGKIPFMRKSEDNKSWFSQNIYHLK